MKNKTVAFRNFADARKKGRNISAVRMSYSTYTLFGLWNAE